MTIKYISRSELKNNKGAVAIRKTLTSPVEVINERTIRFTISNDSIDRSKDKVDPNGFQLDNYKTNPVVFYNHQSDQYPIGRCIDIGVEGNAVKATVEFVPQDVPIAGDRADAILKLIRLGFLSATSIGFVPLQFAETKDDDRGAGSFDAGVDFNKVELLEWSIVTIPDNPQALIEPNQRSGDIADVDDTLNDNATLNINNIQRQRRMRLVELHTRI